MNQSVKIHTPFIKLDDFLKLSGAVLSGGEAKKWIQGGKVTVNGAVCTVRGKKLARGDAVQLNEDSFSVEVSDS